jgi:hypothetical protein
VDGGVELRRGLSVVLLCWVLITVASSCVQVLATHATVAAGRDPRVAASVVAVSSLATLLYRLFYSVMTAIIAAGLWRMTRASSQPVRRPYWVATVSLSLAAAINLLALGVGDAGFLLASYLLARAIGIAALLFGTSRLSSVRSVRTGAVTGVVISALFLMDLTIPVLDASRTAWGVAHPWSARVLTLMPQIGLTAAFAWLCIGLFRVLPQPEVRAEEAEVASPERSSRASEPPTRSDQDAERASVQPEDAHAREAERRAAIAQLAVVALAVLGAGLLPIWDVVSDERIVEGLASRLYGHGARNEATSLLVLVIPALALVLGRSLFQAFPAQPYRARAVFAAMALLGAAYTLHAAHGLALSRSQLASTWPTCPPSAQVSQTAADGIIAPRTADGAPCLPVTERPGAMQTGRHDVSLRDGIVNITARFPGDRLRFFGGTLLSLAALGWAGFLVFRVEE